MSRACRQQTSLRLWERNALALGWWDQWVASSTGHTLVLWVNLPEGKSFSYSTFGFSGQRPRRLCERSRKDSSTETSGWAHFFGPWSFCGNWMAKIPVMGSCALLGVRLRLRVKKTEKNGVPIWDVGRPQKIGWSSGPVETAKIVVFDVLCIWKILTQSHWSYVKRFHLRYDMQNNSGTNKYPKQITQQICNEYRLRSGWVGPSSYGPIMVTGL